MRADRARCAERTERIVTAAAAGDPPGRNADVGDATRAAAKSGEAAPDARHSALEATARVEVPASIRAVVEPAPIGAVMRGAAVAALHFGEFVQVEIVRRMETHRLPPSSLPVRSAGIVRVCRVPRASSERPSLTDWR